MFSFLAVIVALAALPISTAAGSFFAGHGSAKTLTTQAEIDYGIGLINGSAKAALPIATASGTTTVTNTYSYKINATLSGTAEYKGDMLSTNMTLNNMNLYAVNQLNIAISAKGNVTLILGSGSIGKNLSFVFNPLLQESAFLNGSKNLNFSITPALLTGNQSQDLMMEVQFANATANPTYSLALTPIGSSGPEPWYLAGESSGLIVGGVVLFVVGFLAMPFVDINMSRFGSAPVYYRKNLNYRGPANPVRKPAQKLQKKGGRK